MNPGLGLIKELLDLYKTLDYEKENRNGTFKTIVDYTTERLLVYGLKDVKGVQLVSDIFIYPKEYFNPLEHINQLQITNNTRSIHHYAGTWISPKEKIKKKFVKLLGSKIYGLILKFRKANF